MAEIRKKLTDIIGTFDQYSYFDGFTDGNKLDIQSKFPTEVPHVAEKEKQVVLEMLDMEDVYLADEIRPHQNSLTTQKRPARILMSLSVRGIILQKQLFLILKRRMMNTWMNWISQMKTEL